MNMEFDLKSLVRSNIGALEPYSCARDEFKGRAAHVFLDANESPYNQMYFNKQMLRQASPAYYAIYEESMMSDYFLADAHAVLASCMELAS